MERLPYNGNDKKVLTDSNKSNILNIVQDVAAYNGIPILGIPKKGTIWNGFHIKTK